MNITIHSFTEADAPDTWLAVVRADGYKALGEGSSERQAIMDGLNSFLTQRANAETVAKNTNVVDYSTLRPLGDPISRSFRAQADAAAKMWPQFLVAKDTLDVLAEWPQRPSESEGTGPIISKRVATTPDHIHSLLSDAAANDLLVMATYVREDGERSERQIKVSEITDRGLAAGHFPGDPRYTYATVLDMRSGEPRTFRLDRFERAELVG